MIDGRTEPFDATPERVAALCRRRTGIGADGLMILESDPAEEFRMRYFNADGGSEDLLRRAAKLSPIKKSGKDKRTIYSQMDDDEADAELLALRKQESVLDYFDDEQER